MQKYGHLANDVKTAQEFTCEICEAFPVCWTWGDVHGEAMCTVCGTPHQLLQYDEERNRLDLPPKININEEWIPVLKQYWQETKQFTGLATIIIRRDYPECLKGRRKFNERLDEHPELVPQ